MFDHLLESWTNIGFGQEIKELASIEIHFTHLIWRSGLDLTVRENAHILVTKKTHITTKEARVCRL